MPTEKDKKYYLQKIDQQFITSRKIFYPIRPVITFFVGIAIIALALSGFLALAIAVYIAANILSDDTFFFPLIRLINSIRYTKDKRKRLKSIVTLIAIALGITLGIVLAIFILAHIPVILSIVGIVSTTLGCGIVIFIGLSAVFAGISKLLNLPTILGVVVSGIIVTGLSFFIPPVFGVLTELTVASAVLGAFLCTLVAKHSLRLYYKIRYGHPNADGHMFNIENTITEQDRKQATILRVDAKQVSDLRITLQAICKTIKKRSWYIEEFTGTRQLKSNSIKDILNLLLSAQNKEDAHRLSKMLEWIQPETHRLLKSCGVKKEDYDNELRKETGKGIFKQYYPATLNTTITLKYGFCSFFIDPQAKYLYKAVNYVKNVEASLKLCPQELRDKFKEVIRPFSTMPTLKK